MLKLKRERGAGLLSMLFIIIVISFAALFAFRLGPVYIEHFSIVQTLKSVEKDPKSKGITKPELLRTILKRLDINHVYRITREEVKITRTNKGKIVEIAYEVRKPLLWNIDFMVTFKNEVLVTPT